MEPRRRYQIRPLWPQESPTHRRKTVRKREKKVMEFLVESARENMQIKVIQLIKELHGFHCLYSNNKLALI